MSKLLLIIKREFIARVRNKAFVLMTFISPLLLVVMTVFITWLKAMNTDQIHTIAIHDESGEFLMEFEDHGKLRFKNFSSLPIETAKDSVMLKEFMGLLYIPTQVSRNTLEKAVKFYADASPSFEIIQKIETVLSAKLTHQNFVDQGYDIEGISMARANVDLKIENFSGVTRSKLSNYIKIAFGGLMGYLLMMFIVIYGNMIMRSVIEEKTSRIIEIIISSVKPAQLLLGKILGTSFAGLTQFIIWLLIGGLMLSVLTAMAGISISGAQTELALQNGGAAMDQLQLVIHDFWELPLMTLLVSFFVYFLSGYFLYSSMYAAIGAAVDNETDTQQFMLPLLFPLMLGIYIGFFTVMDNPHGSISLVFSMLPFTSPIVMMMRIPFGVPWWQILISVVLLLATIGLTVWFASKIYRIGILMYGKKPSYKELLKWLRY